MGQLEAFFRSASSDVVEALPDHAVVVFELSGEGGGTWTIVRDGPDVRIRHGAAAFSDCRLVCSAPDFIALVTGAISSRDAFLDGRFRVEGDVGLVLRLEQVIRKGRDDEGPRPA